MKDRPRNFNVAVIGAGIVGCATAAMLSAGGRNRVVVIEKRGDAACGATGANTGILHAGYDPEPGNLKARFNLEGFNLWSALIGELGIPYRNCGSLVAAMDGPGERTLEALLRRGEENGVPDLEILDGENALTLSPSLSPDIRAALHALGAGVISPYMAAFALAEFAVLNGAVFMGSTSVVSVEGTGGDAGVEGSGTFRLTGKGPDGEASVAVETKAVVNAAGTHAGIVAGLFGDRSISIYPRRGEYHVLDSATSLELNNVAFPVPSAKGKGVVVCPTVDGNYLVGPGAVDMPDPDDTATTEDEMDSIWEQARELVPSLNRKDIISQFVGVRAVPHGGDFIVRESKVCDGLFHAAGIESPGLTAAPAIALELVRQLEKVGLAKSPFPADADVDAGVDAEMLAELFRRYGGHGKSRYTENAARRQQRAQQSVGNGVGLAQRRAESGASAGANGVGAGGVEAAGGERIVCRCEQVGESRVVEAVTGSFPAGDLDGIKKRTRCGMGRCQGGFCTPRLVDIMEEQRGIDPLELTRKGGKSLLFTGRTRNV